MGTTSQKLAYTSQWVTDAYNAVNSRGGSISLSSPLAQLGAAIRAIPTPPPGNNMVYFSPISGSVPKEGGMIMNVYHSGNTTYEIIPEVEGTFNNAFIDGQAEASYNGGIRSSTMTIRYNPEASARTIRYKAYIGGVYKAMFSVLQPRGDQMPYRTTFITTHDMGGEVIPYVLVTQEDYPLDNAETNQQGSVQMEGTGIFNYTRFRFEKAGFVTTYFTLDEVSVNIITMERL